jgi:hypothetical protein
MRQNDSHKENEETAKADQNKNKYSQPGFTWIHLDLAGSGGLAGTAAEVKCRGLFEAS